LYRKNNVVGQEEPRPIRVADVERMLKAFLLTSQPLVVLVGEVSATKVDVLQASTRATPTTSGGSASSGSLNTDLDVMSGTKRGAESSSGSTSSKRSALDGKVVQRPRNGPPDEKATSAQVSSSNVQLTETASHRYPRAAHGRKNHVVNIGPAEDRALYVRVNDNDDTYHLSMPRLDIYDHTPYALYNARSDYDSVRDLWNDADLKELKSIILVNKVWDVRPLPEGRKPLTPKWVRMTKKEDTKKSRLVVRGFHMIHRVDYEETFSSVAKMVTF
jgi:hypothetical protein